MKRRIRVVFLLVFSALVLGILGVKAARQGWLTVPPPLELNGQPALLYFTLSEGCDCQMKIIRHADTQIAFWKLPDHLKIKILRIDFEKRPDLAGYYQVDRAPALVLLGQSGEVFWMQDEPQSDDVPFDMAEVEEQIASLRAADGR